MVKLRTLVLNNNYMPISVIPNVYNISAEHAILRYLNGTCEIVKSYDRKILTQSRNDLFWPSVIVNKRNSWKHNAVAQLKPYNLYYRDHGLCMYCEKPLTLNSTSSVDRLTKDHVFPISKGGKNDWNNVVASCVSCNLKKGDNLPFGKWKPKKQPHMPSYFELMDIREKFPIKVYDESWIEFLPRWRGEIQVVNQIEINTQ